LIKEVHKNLIPADSCLGLVGHEEEFEKKAQDGAKRKTVCCHYFLMLHDLGLMTNNVDD